MQVNRLSSELDHERGQLAEAQAKRQEEHAAFVNEQTDFDNSIAACGKARSSQAWWCGATSGKEEE